MRALALTRHSHFWDSYQLAVRPYDPCRGQTGGSMATRADAIAVGGTAEYSIWRVILASAVGTMIEWYDFYIFGSLAAVLSPKFYPPGNETVQYGAYPATLS